MLAAPRTYHVGPAGNDANSGLSEGEAFATLQKAVDAALALDAAGNAVTIRLADGTYAGAAMSRPMFDSGTLTIQGNYAAPQNVGIDGGRPGPARRCGRREDERPRRHAHRPDRAWGALRRHRLSARQGRLRPVTARHVGAFPDGKSWPLHIAGTLWSTRKYMNMTPLFVEQTHGAAVA